jgi:anti-sigma factor RsiW
MAARAAELGRADSGRERREAADRTLRAALSLPVKAPDMAKFGFELAAVRVSAGVPGGSAVTLAYRDAQQRLFTLYLRHTDTGERFEMLKRGPVRICVWQDEVLSAVMVAEVSAGEMLRLATLAYDGLSAA